MTVGLCDLCKYQESCKERKEVCFDFVKADWVKVCKDCLHYQGCKKLYADCTFACIAFMLKSIYNVYNY